MSAMFILLYTVVPLLKNSPPPTAKVSVPDSIPKPAAAKTIPYFSVTSPVQLKISRINVDTATVPVGINAEGDMDIDENPEQAAWYKLGAKPGQEGSAVIAGHYGWKNGVASVFNDLHTLVAGDEISTVGEDGKTVTFVVTRLMTYMPNQDATDVFRSDDGKAHLNLVTCQGSWNNSESTYSERLVVFSDLVVQ